MRPGNMNIVNNVWNVNGAGGNLLNLDEGHKKYVMKHCF